MFDAAPEEWREVSLADMCRIAIGGTPSRAEPRYWSNAAEGHHWVSIADLRSPIINQTKEFISDEGVQNSNVKLVPRGTVLMSFKLTIGRTAVAGCDLYTNEAIAAFTPNGDLDNDFLFHWLPHLVSTVETDQAVKGVTLNKQKLAAISGALPPLDEQRRIAEVLRAVDDVIAANVEAVNQAACLLRQYRFALTGLDGSRPDWPQGPLLDFFQLQRGHDLPVQDRKDGSIPVIASNGTVGTHNEAAIPAPAVVTGRSGTIGKVTYFDGPCWPLNTTLFVRDYKGSNPRYVFHFLSAFPLTDYQSGTGVPTLNRNDVHIVEVAWPTLEEQVSIAASLDALEQSVATMTAGLDQLRTLKVQLSGDLLSGRVRVPA
jgi:type I restriction enzyme S subunit